MITIYPSFTQERYGVLSFDESNLSNLQGLLFDLIQKRLIYPNPLRRGNLLLFKIIQRSPATYFYISDELTNLGYDYCIVNSGIGPLDVDYKIDSYFRLTRNIEDTVKRFRNNLFNVDKTFEVLKDLEDGKLTPFNLMDHQRAAIVDGMFRSNYGIFFEMRLGKTITSLSLIYLYRLLFDIKHFLVVCPISSLEAWEKEVLKFKAPINLVMLSFTNGENLVSELEDSKGKLEKNEYSLNLYVSHYEFFRTKRSQKFFDFWYTLTNDNCNGTGLIIDEAHKCKNTNTLNHKTLFDLSSRARKVIGLTGTPIGGTIEDVYGLSRVLRSNHLINAFSLSSFREKYMFRIGHTNFFKPLKNSYSILVERISKFSISAKQSDVFKEAKVINEVIHYKLNKQQLTRYKSILEGILTELDEGIITVNNALVESIKLLQICSGFLITPKDADKTEFFVEEFETEKDDLLLDILDTYQSEQTIVWILFDYEDEKLLKLLRNNKISARSISGQTSKAKRLEILDDFRKGAFRALISKPSILGAGVDLSNAHISIFYSRDYSYINRDQALSRQLNISKPGIYTVIDLVGANTIDEKILEALSSKRDITNEIKDKSSFKKFVFQLP